MKCGTTWMQQVVYEVLSRGQGDLGDSGHVHMYAVSPWIEARASVSMEDAPRIGPGAHRIVRGLVGVGAGAAQRAVRAQRADARQPGQGRGDVAAFLGVELTPAERARVVEKSGFAYMKEHEERFEMAAPTPFSTGDGSFLASGSADRDRDVGPADRERIAAFCRERLAGASYPLARFYPEIARSAEARSAEIARSAEARSAEIARSDQSRS